MFDVTLPVCLTHALQLSCGAESMLACHHRCHIDHFGVLCAISRATARFGDALMRSMQPMMLLRCCNSCVVL
jgi:hypothetical protein